MAGPRLGVHGLLVVVTFLLSRRAGWSIPFTLLNLAAGLIPLIIFWVERRVVERMRAEHPELVGSSLTNGLSGDVFSNPNVRDSGGAA